MVCKLGLGSPHRGVFSPKSMWLKLLANGGPLPILETGTGRPSTSVSHTVPLMSRPQQCPRGAGREVFSLHGHFNP